MRVKCELKNYVETTDFEIGIFKIQNQFLVIKVKRMIMRN